MNDALNLARQFLATLRYENERWLVGVSGGGDSVALLRLLHQVGLKDKVVVGCFNHHWSAFGNESAYFVTALAGELGFKAKLGQGSGKAATNAEAFARNERMAWFEETCQENGLAGVLLAHTQDDLVETFLMRAGKGSGLSGLASMQALVERDGLLWQRPLLDVRRAELRAYLESQDQVWLEDPDNEAGGSQRAKVRKLLAPLEAAGITVQGMAASVAALNDAEAFMVAVVDEFPILTMKDMVTLDANALGGLMLEPAVRVLGRVIRMVIGDEDAMLVRRSKRVALWERLGSEEKGHATLGGVKFAWAQGTLTARKE